MQNFKVILAVLKKDLKSEIRTRYAISALLLFVLVSVTMLAFSTAGEKLSEGISSAFIWILMFFASMTGLAKSFVSEEERGTSLYLKLHANTSSIYFGKLLFNITLSLGMNALIVFLFVLFNNSVEISLAYLFVLNIFLASLAFAGATTIISAIISKANSKSAIMPVLAFPVLLPLIIVGIENTNLCFLGAKIDSIYKNFGLIVAYTGIMITSSYLLFPIVWED